MKSIFVSFSSDDRKWLEKIKRWQKKNRLGTGITIIGETEDVRPGGENAIKKHLAPKLQGMSLLLVAVGDNAHDRLWVNYEVHCAKSYHKKIMVGRIPDTTGAAPPECRDLDEIILCPTAIVKALKEVY